MHDLHDFVAKRKAQREFRKKQNKKYIYVFLFVLFLIIFIFVKKKLEYKVEFLNIKFDTNKVSTVNFVDKIESVEQINEVMLERYYIQADISGKNKSILYFSNKLSKEGIDNYLVTDGKVVRLNIIKSFDTIEDAEKYADELKKKKLIENYIIRVR